VGKLDFGRVGRVIDHVIDKFVQLVLETRKGYNQTVYLYTPSGDNSVPCKEDRLIILKVDGTGKYIAVSVATESQGAKPGEKIFFGRDPDSKIVSKITMLNNGSVNVETDGDMTTQVEENLTVTIKGDVEFEATGDITETGKKDITKGAAGKYTIKGAIIEIRGTTELILKTIGASLWCPNGVINCFICGAPHGGPSMGIVGLKGAS
jgi:hypothetical protein